MEKFFILDIVSHKFFKLVRNIPRDNFKRSTHKPKFWTSKRVFSFTFPTVYRLKNVPKKLVFDKKGVCPLFSQARSSQNEL